MRFSPVRFQSYGQMITETGGSHATTSFPWKSDAKVGLFSVKRKLLRDFTKCAHYAENQAVLTGYRMPF